MDEPNHSNRKADHIDICLDRDVRAGRDYWDDVSLVHQALPEIDMDELDLGARLFGRQLKAPIVIAAITGGYDRAREINETLAKGAARYGLGMGVGSQRAAIVDPSLEGTYSVVRDHDVPLRIANLGAPQLIEQPGREAFGIDETKHAMEMIDAHILAVHLNYLQEVVQPEGDARAKGCLSAIREIALKLPVLAKETGAGMNREVALALKDAGVRGLDLGGLGGTSFSAVEVYRAEREGNVGLRETGMAFWDWGIPTPVSVATCQVGLPLVATGGIRTGLDVARALAMGADCAGMAGRLLGPAVKGPEALYREIEVVLRELRAAMFLTGSGTVAELRKRPYIVHGRTREWLEGL